MATEVNFGLVQQAVGLSMPDQLTPQQIVERENELTRLRQLVLSADTPLSEFNGNSETRKEYIMINLIGKIDVTHLRMVALAMGVVVGLADIDMAELTSVAARATEKNEIDLIDGMITGLSIDDAIQYANRMRLVLHTGMSLGVFASIDEAARWYHIARTIGEQFYTQSQMDMAERYVQLSNYQRFPDF